MLNKVFRAWSFTIIGGAVIPGVALFLIMEPWDDFYDLLFYSTVGLVFGAAFIPTLLGLLYTADKYKDLDEAEVRDKLAMTHFVWIAVTFIGANILISALMPFGGFFGLQLGFTLAVTIIYSIGSWISWTLVFRKRSDENEDVLDQN